MYVWYFLFQSSPAGLKSTCLSLCTGSPRSFVRFALWSLFSTTNSYKDFLTCTANLYFKTFLMLPTFRVIYFSSLCLLFWFFFSPNPKKRLALPSELPITFNSTRACSLNALIFKGMSFFSAYAWTFDSAKSKVNKHPIFLESDLACSC